MASLIRSLAVAAMLVCSISVSANPKKSECDEVVRGVPLDSDVEIKMGIDRNSAYVITKSETYRVYLSKDKNFILIETPGGEITPIIRRHPRTIVRFGSHHIGIQVTAITRSLKLVRLRS